MVNGKVHRRSTGMRDLDMARRRASEFDRDVRAGKVGWVEVPTYREWVARYLTHRAKLRKGAERRDPALLAPSVTHFGDKRLDAIRRSDCEEYIGLRMMTGRASGSIWLECVRSRLLFRLAIDDELIARNPWKGVKLPKVRQRTRVLTVEEEIKLRSVLAPTWGRFLTVMLGTGLRRTEFWNLRPAHVDVENRVIRLPGECAKGGKGRIIPLRPEVLAALIEQLPLPWSDGQTFWPCCAFTPWRAINVGVRNAGIPPFTLHDLRRTFGTRCAESGMPLSHLQKIMGHSSPAVTSNYYIHLGERNVVDSLLNLQLPVVSGTLSRTG